MALTIPASATPPINPTGSMNPLEQLRLGGMFPQQLPPYNPTPGGMPVQDNTPLGQIGGMVEGDVMGQPPGPIQSQYEPQTGATDFFNELLAAYPEHKQSIVRTIGNAMLALNDPGLAHQLQNAPTTEQRDWAAKMGPAQAAMTQERYGNTNNRMYANQLSRDELALKRLGQGDVRLGQRDVQLGQGQQKIDETITHNRATEELNTYKAQFPNQRIIELDDGRIVGINPQDPTQVTPVPGAENWSFAEKEDLKQQNLLERQSIQNDRIDERAEDNQSAIASRQATSITAASNRVNEAARLSAEREATARIGRLGRDFERERMRAARPPSASASGNKALEERRVISNKAQRAMAEHPEWSEFIELDGDKVTLMPVSRGGFFSRGPDQATYDAMFKAVYGTTTPTAVASVASDDKVIVQDKDGKRFRLPKSQLEAALAQEYTLVEEGK